MFSEDLDGFFDDFGVIATFGSESAKVLYDSPEAIIADDFISADHRITYKTGLFQSLARQSAIVVDGVTFKVNKVYAKDDGKLTVAELSKP